MSNQLKTAEEIIDLCIDFTGREELRQVVVNAMEAFHNQFQPSKTEQPEPYKPVPTVVEMAEYLWNKWSIEVNEFCYMTKELLLLSLQDNAPLKNERTAATEQPALPDEQIREELNKHRAGYGIRVNSEGHYSPNEGRFKDAITINNAIKAIKKLKQKGE